MVKRLIQEFLGNFGLKLSRLPTKEQIQLAAAEEKNKTLWLRNKKIKTVLDIGANTGQFVISIHQICSDATIYSFEPLTDCYEELIANFGNLPNFHAFNLALGNQTGQLEINRNEFSPSSSFLPMGNLHKEAFPYTQKSVVEKVNITKLDLIAEKLQIEKPILIKIDVQGFEKQVLDGGKETISQADIIIIEISLEYLYEGQPLFHEIYQKLINLGFEYGGNFYQLHDTSDGKILQIDAIFRKNKA